MSSVSPPGPTQNPRPTMDSTSSLVGRNSPRRPLIFAVISVMVLILLLTSLVILWFRDSNEGPPEEDVPIVAAASSEPTATKTATAEAPSSTPPEIPSPTSAPTFAALPPTPTSGVTLVEVLPSPTPFFTPSPTSTNTPSPAPRPRNPDMLIYVQSSGQGPVLNLIKSNGEFVGPLHERAAAPAWSPDGSHIAFFGDGISQLAPLNNVYQQGNGIWLIDSQGKNPRQLVEVDHVKSITWSADGTKIAFEVDSPSETPEIRVIRADDGNEIARFPGKEPAWSVDSQRLAVNKNCVENKCGIWFVDYLGGGETQKTKGGSDSYPALSPDSRYLAFTSRERNDNWDIYLVRLPDGEPKRLTSGIGTNAAPVFSPDSQEVYFLSDKGGAWKIWAISINGNNERLIASGITQNMKSWGLVRPAVRR